VIPTLAVDALAAYRLTRLVVKDSFPLLRRTRDRITKRYQLDTNDLEVDTDGTVHNHWVVELLDCPWCAGFWVSLGVLAARRSAPVLWRPVAEALAVSAVVGLIGQNLDPD
jgi:hypothetical protein